MESIEEYKVEVSKKLDIPKTDVDELTKQTLDSVAKRFAHLDGEKLLVKQIGVLKSFFRSYGTQKALQYDFAPILDGGVQWRYRRRIATILEKYHKDPMAAEELLNSKDVVIVKKEIKKDGVVTIKEVPVVHDTNETYKNGNKNRNFGKPLVESKFRIITVEFIDEDGNQHLGEISLNGSDTDIQLKLFNPSKGFFNKGKNKRPSGAIPLNWKRGTKITDSDVKFDIKKIIDTRFDDKILPMDKLDDALEFVKNNPNDNLFVIKAELSDKSRLDSENPSIRIQMAGELGDDVVDLYCKIPPENVPSFTVPLYADLYAIGQLWRVGEGEDAFTGMTAQAVYSDEVDVEAPPVSAEQLSPGDEEW